MKTTLRTEQVLIGLCALLFLWFFASSLSIAFVRAPQHDDIMFVTLPKNLLTGYGWATSYGEKIPFNPDLTAGPSMLLPAAAMIALFGNQPWIPAVTGTLINILLSVLVLLQLIRITRNRLAHCFAFIISMSLYAVHDFRTFTGYYGSALLFIFSLLLVLNPRYSVPVRLAAYGALAAIGLYAKPLILLSYMLAWPGIVWCINREQNETDKTTDKPISGISQWTTQFIKQTALAAAVFLLVLAPWHIYKTGQLASYDKAYQQAYLDYQTHFFVYHGTGIAQLMDATDKISYVTKNIAKNYRIVGRFLSKEYNFPVLAVTALLAAVFLWSFYFRKNPVKQKSSSDLKFLYRSSNLSIETKFCVILAAVIFFHYLWYVIISFAMTPGHAYFPSWFCFFLLFFFVAQLFNASCIAIIACLAITLLFPVRHQPTLDAYSFRNDNPYFKNSEILEAVDAVKKYQAKANKQQLPLASCGYHGAPWRLEFLLPGSGHFLDCFNILEDALVLDEKSYWADNPNLSSTKNGKPISAREHFFTSGMHEKVKVRFHWGSKPDFALAVEGFGLFIAKSRSYVLDPVLRSCENNIHFQNGSFALCEVYFRDIEQQLDPAETARQLIEYQHWYRTRLVTYP